jgi:hypothetical protein
VYILLVLLSFVDDASWNAPRWWCFVSIEGFQIIKNKFFGLAGLIYAFLTLVYSRVSTGKCKKTYTYMHVGLTMLFQYLMPKLPLKPGPAMIKLDPVD